MTSTSSHAETPRAEARLGLTFGRTSDAMPVPIRPERPGSLWWRIARVLLTYRPRAIPHDALLIARGVT